ncbi:MAG: GtrA family protein [Pseudomonadota bacterium]|nr:GtrA family protein [Pseudomonadota bacterium]
MIKTIIKLYLWAESIWFPLPQKLRFLLVGGFNTVFAYSLLAVILWFFEGINQRLALNYIPVIVANAALFVQYVITINVSFLTMRYYVFQSHGDWKHEFVKAWSVYIFLYMINSPILSFLMVIVGLSPLVSQALYLTFSTIVTFILHKYYSFRRRTGE